MGKRDAAARLDAIVVGAGPNGLAAAVELARAGCSVRVYEAAERIGGGTRSDELTLPGFVHDVCSAIHPLGVGSPFFRTLPLAEHGLEWIEPEVPLAHPFDDGTAALLEHSVEATGATLGPDAEAYRDLFAPLVEMWPKIERDVLGPLGIPRHPFLMARFGLLGLRSAKGLAESRFEGERARALFAGLAAHSTLQVEWTPTASFGLVLAILAHATGWPMARGGSQRIADALASYLASLGGEIVTGERVASLDALPPSRAVLCDVTPRQLLAMAGDRLPDGYRKRLGRYRYGPGAFKVDWALSAPIPWKAPECARAGTVHLGPTLEEIAASERAAWSSSASLRPYLLVGQPSLFDPSRAPEGKHVAWAYCHVPHGSTFDMTERIEEQMERFAPGFRDVVLGRHAFSPADLERHDANLVGGDVNGGLADLKQLFVRPTRELYSVPVDGLYLCSSSTPPGGGVHGMCGFHAARAALNWLKSRR